MQNSTTENHGRYIKLDDAKAMITKALREFDEDLGERAQNILLNEERMNIVEVTEARTNMMVCRPAGLTIEDLKSADMYTPDYEEQYGPDFTQQDNPSDHAIIDFEYDGSPKAIIWLGHELGHALADDIQQENGHSFRDFSSDEMEGQAYFVQHIVSKHVRANIDNIVISQDNLGENIADMSAWRAKQFQNASALFNSASEAIEQEGRAKIALAALDPKQEEQLETSLV